MIDVRMLTRCPYCDTAFRVYEHQLARREGKVRCGACGNVFDAYQTLEHGADPLAVDGPGSEAPPARVRASDVLAERARREASREQPTDDPVDPWPQRGHAPAPDHAEDFERGASDHVRRTDVLLEGRTDPPAPGERRVTIADPAPDEPQHPARWSAPSREADAQEHEPLESDARGSISRSPIPAGPDSRGPAVDEPAEAPQRAHARRRDADPLLDRPGSPASRDPLLDEPAAPAPEIVFRPGPPPASPLLWASAIALALGLSAQSLFWFRDELAARLPPLGQLLTDTCRLAGCQVRLPRHADLIAIESSELQSDPSGVLVLSTTLRNKAGFAQALPALELTLTDARELPVVRRVLAPRDYLGKPEEPGMAIPPGGELATRVYIDATSAGASGYRVFIFYP